jgi:hypothetical protein
MTFIHTLASRDSSVELQGFQQQLSKGAGNFPKKIHNSELSERADA